MRRIMGSKRGFTLVELIVVLVILAILAALLMPSLTGYIDAAREKTYITECRNLVQAAHTLVAEDYAANQFDAATFLEDHKDEIFALADLEKREPRDIREITFDAASGATIATLIYRPVNGLTVKYERMGDPVYTVNPDVGAVAYESVWTPIINKLANKTSGEMRKAIEKLYNDTFPTILSDEANLLAGSGSIKGLAESTRNNLQWKPAAVKSADNGYVLIATTGGDINANLVYYQGSYYGCVNKTYNGSLKLDTMNVTDNVQISDLLTAQTLAYYEENPAEVTNKCWVKLR